MAVNRNIADIRNPLRRSINAAMKKLNYRPNEVARSLSKQTTNTIGVIVPHISHPYFAQMISHVENTASKKGYKIILCNTKGKDEMEKKYLEMCSSNRVAGVILFSSGVSVDEFAGSNIPLVTVERFIENGTAAVECDNIQGGRLATEHLVLRGCTNLLHVSGVSDSAMPADDRAKGFEEVCRKENIPFCEVATTLTQYEKGEYHEMLESIMLEHPEVDGVFTSSDLIAAQLIQVCNRIGRRVPQDVKIVGFDDTLIAGLTTPDITTIHQPIKEMATAAVELLISAAEGNTVAKRTLLPVKLVERGSSADNE